MRFLFILTVGLGLVGCGPDENRGVVSLTSPQGHAFTFMPINERGVTDITISVAWPSDWARTPGQNLATPYVGAETILSGATQTLNQAEIAAAFEDMNAFGTLIATPDFLRGEVSFPREHTDAVVDIANALIRTPQFDSGWVERIKGQLADNQADLLAANSTQLFMAARLAILGDTPNFSFLSLPDPSVIRDVGINDLRTWHQNTLTQTDVEVVVTGAISAEDAGTVVDNLLDGLPKGVAISAAPPRHAIPMKTVLLHLPDAEKTSLAMFGALPDFTDGDTALDGIATTILGRQGDGPLFTALRTELRAAYSVEVGMAAYDYANRFVYIFAEVETEKATAASETLLASYADFLAAPDLSGFPDVRDEFANIIDEQVGYVDGAAYLLMEAILAGDVTPTEVPTLKATIGALTEDQLRERIAAAFPPADELLIVMASPDPNALPGACIITEVRDILDCP